SNGKVQIKDGLSYFEHGTSDFQELQMSGGNINISLPEVFSLNEISQQNPSPSDISAQMMVQGTFNGTVYDFSVGDNSFFIGNTLSFDSIQHFHLKNNAAFHSPNSFELAIKGDYENKGALSSSGILNLLLNDDVDNLGLIIAKEQLDLLFNRKAKLQNKIYDKLYLEKQYHGQIFTKKKITHIDNYLNTITEHYEPILDRYGRETSRRYSHKTETGYIWQNRETRVEENKDGIPAEILKALQQLDAGLQNTHNYIMEMVEQLNELQKEIAQKAKEYNRDLMRALLKSGGSHSDILVFKDEPLLRILGMGSGTEHELDQVRSDYPDIDDWFRQSQIVRESISPLMRILAHPAMQFVNEVVIPAAIVATIMAGDVFFGGMLVPATAPALVGCCARLAPVIERAAIALGAQEAYKAAVDGVKVVFSKVGNTKLPERTEPVGENGAFWKSIEPKTAEDARWLASLKRKAIDKQSEIRFDGKYFYQFDRFHKWKFGEHMHRYVKEGKRARLDANIDPQTGRIIKEFAKGDTNTENWF
ncbi:MAG: hypothetical protein LBJ89_02785, partial [Holosporales bacterium]|nr:hypothetical protein [Holosporales bacterium]